MKLKNNWKQKTLENLEKENLGESVKAPTDLVTKCLELRKIPLESFSTENLRLMIVQQIGLVYLVPIAIEKIKQNLWIEGDLCEGDLLQSVLNIDTGFWDGNKEYWLQLNELIDAERENLIYKRYSIRKFDDSIFSTKKESH